MNYSDLNLPAAGDTVVVGLSGGVDSTLTAYMLKNRGCRVIGVTMSLWDESFPVLRDENGQPKALKDACFGPGEADDIEECKCFCSKYDIEYHVIDVKEKYKKEVIEYFKAEYRAGRTPNPCIRCNRMIKFGALMQGVRELGIDFDYFCTGHYAKVVRPDTGLFGTDIRPAMIAGAADVSKDQTYFIYRVPADVLEKVRFPLALMKKSEVFELAHELGLEAAERDESQDFVSAEYFDLLFADVPSKPGDIIDLDGHVIGHHRGIEHYTIGQRRGLDVAVGYPVYVHSIDAKNNVVVLAPNAALDSVGLIADDFVWAGGVEPPDGFKAMVKIRLASKQVPATIERYTPATEDDYSYKGQVWKVSFETPQRAIAPGQSVVLYDDGVIVGGGIIASALRA
ncbi:MAG: tRNA 2-thiouridine(34) synthase MnmA [Treponema sp.]|nr:tRNA 2-thiouridine(34) synthase MnmA [Treponema sp.]